MNATTISPLELHAVAQTSRRGDLIDVRTPLEFRAAHATFARNMPLDQLDSVSLSAGPSHDVQPLYPVCQSSIRGKRACEKLIDAGSTNVIDVDRGTQAWIDSGLPVVRGQKSKSLERQIRIAAGLLGLIGTQLSYFAHPYRAALPALVGAGLMFAGITGTCGIGLMLARTPWNRVEEPANPTVACPKE